MFRMDQPSVRTRKGGSSSSSSSSDAAVAAPVAAAAVAAASDPSAAPSAKAPRPGSTAFHCQRAGENMHWREQPSPLSMGAEKQDYRGFLNLLVIVVVVMNARLVIENMMKYGLLISFSGPSVLPWETSKACLLTLVAIFVTGPAIAYGIEAAATPSVDSNIANKDNGKKSAAGASAAKPALSASAAFALHVVNVMAHFFFPLGLIWLSASSLASRYILAFMTILLTMKLISFAHVSSDIRADGARVAVFNSGMVCAFDPQNPPNVAKLGARVRPAFATYAKHESSSSSGSSNAESSAAAALADCASPASAPTYASGALPLSSSSGSAAAAAAAAAADAADGGASDAATLAASLGLIDTVPEPAAVPDVLTYEVKPYRPSLSHLYYYLAAPTLVFQVWYPRSARVRKSFVFRRLAELVFTSCIIVFVVEQYVKPTLLNSLVYFDNGDVPAIVERVLKMCIPNTIVWLLIFYALFHSYLNLVAELMRFGDRVFYRDWWNSGDLGVYWRLWNRPVHDWLVKHVYYVAIRGGYSPRIGQLVVFFLSALLHEVIVSVPCQIVSIQVFMAMLVQVPVIAVTQWVHRRSQNPVFGNVTFWCALCIFGQPLLILIYGYQYLRA